MTADTYSNTLGFLIMGVGNDNNTWGGNCSTSVFQIFEDAIANALTNSVTGGTLDLSGTPPPAAASQTRYAALIFSGVLTSNQIVQVPNLQKFWFVQNATSGAFTLKIKTPTGSASTAIPQNSGWQVVYCDGANNIVVHPFNTKQIQMPDGSASAPAYSDINETNSGWYRNGTQDWRLSINGVDVLQATGTGAGTPSVFNVLSPLSLQLAGSQVIPPGMEAPYAGITAPTGWLFEAGQAISRATYAALFTAITATCTGDTHTSTTLNNLSTDLRGLGLEGAYIERTGIATGTTIVSIDSATSLTLSQAASSSTVGGSVRILPYGQGDASTTFNVPDRRGVFVAGRDNMLGTAKGNLSKSTTQGIDGTKLNANGGQQAHTLTQPELPTTLGNSQETGVPWGISGPNNISAPAGGTQTPFWAGPVDIAASGLTIVNSGGGQLHNVVPPAGVSNYIIKT